MARFYENRSSSIEDEKPPWAKDKAEPQYEVDIEEESEEEFRRDCEVSVQEEPEVQFVSEKKKPLRARLKAKASSSRVAEADKREEDDMESLAPLKRKRQ